ncbi:MAG: serine hydrolase, partial [Betaproteobacteria bacterium]
MLKCLGAAVLGAVVLGGPAGALAPLGQQLDAIASTVRGTVGYSVLDLTSGDRIGRLQNDVFPTASTIKLAILYELFKQADEGTVRLDERVRLDRGKAVGGSGVLFQLGTPTLSIRDYATLMVIVSDNTATNVLIDRLGLDRVTRRMAALGLHETKLRRRMMDAAARERGDENVSTPFELVRLLEILNAGAGLSPGAREGAMAMLEKPKTSRLRAGVPAGVPVADKPGELEGIRVDAGIVFAGRPYVLAVMTRSLQREQEGERAIADMSRAAYVFFTKKEAAHGP